MVRLNTDRNNNSDSSPPKKKKSQTTLGRSLFILENVRIQPCMLRLLPGNPDFRVLSASFSTLRFKHIVMSDMKIRHVDFDFRFDDECSALTTVTCGSRTDRWLSRINRSPPASPKIITFQHNLHNNIDNSYIALYPLKRTSSRRCTLSDTQRSIVQIQYNGHI